SKTKFTFKGPAYNMFADSVAGGVFGSMMRWAGYDHLVITGRARRPVYLYINNDRVELRDAGRIWGKGAKEANHAIKAEVGDEELDTACIGPAGENLVTFASITTSGWRSAGRCGGGAVMGSKNLKAIAVKGTKGIRATDPQAFFKQSLGMIERMQALPIMETWKKEGTLQAVDIYDTVGSNPYKNSQGIVNPPDLHDKITASVYTSLFKIRPLSCSPGCSTACSAFHRVEGHETPLAHKYRGAGDKPEYLTVASFGSMCNIPDYAAISHFYVITSDYAVDFLEIGNICAFLMELWERGIVTAQDMHEWTGEPITMEWGNVDAVDKVMESIVFQRNRLGEIFRGGAFQGGSILEQMKGVPVLKYCVYGKGGSVINEELRPFGTWMTNMAVSSRGCDHLKAVTLVDKMGRTDISEALLGRPEAGHRFVPDLKGGLSAITEHITCVYNCLGVCILVALFDPINLPPGTHTAAYTAVTGMPITPEEIYLVGKRTANMEKAFNSRLGYARQDDLLCDRWMNETLADPGPTPAGIKAGDYLDHTLTEYYMWQGWDPATSLQKRETLEQLDLKDVADVLAREGFLVG
ncbi:MAG: aldehyde ferredoxin oxidoreductase C-terminal domain-containing protein, partial [Dehalococcoidia bacterium]|nr:aldehyde ferredoxin oxidoreductase C-terminal domain-containing protein [Dehalococcoidia bacterium]